ncbi:alpha/beta fold hydrolase [Actinotalea sp. K2]|uniref:alpha/beta fold hydrolase n=1 Tax=Actinotalea sp. K2 TaxID=2939438 RepID=UPI002017362C|nr:alpha/beta hydrolase [Actinotalea sp. K2]MCL3859438.1 alpha/beta hydrolase [Actinotalea sp. K2]
MRGSGRVGTVAWQSWGSPEATAMPVLLLHGVTDSSGCWAGPAEQLARGSHVVAQDARGHGDSPLLQEPFTIAALAADAARVLREVIGRPALVVGHSMGGVTAQELALTEPDLVAGLVLEDPAWVTVREVDTSGVPLWMRQTLASYRDVTAEELEERSRVEHPTWAPEVHVAWAEAKVVVDQGLADVPHAWDGRDWVEAMAGLAMPVTLLTGDPAQGAIVRPAQVSRVVELLGAFPDGNLVHVPVPHVGHCIRYEAPLRFLDAVEDALVRSARLHLGVDARAVGEV